MNGFELKSRAVNVDGMCAAFTIYGEKWKQAASYIYEVCGATPVITSAKDGTHSKNSLHTSGQAVDIRISDWKGDIYAHARVIAWILGEPWVVVAELGKAHLHIQVSLKNIINPGAFENIAGAYCAKG